MGVRCAPKLVVNLFLNGLPFSPVIESKFTNPCQYLFTKIFSTYLFIKTFSTYLFIKTFSTYLFIKAYSTYLFIKTLSLGLFITARVFAALGFRCSYAKCFFSEKASQLLHLLNAGFSLSPALPIFSMLKEVPRDPFHLTFNLTFNRAFS